MRRKRLKAIKRRSKLILYTDQDTGFSGWHPAKRLLPNDNAGRAANDKRLAYFKVMDKAARIICGKLFAEGGVPMGLFNPTFPSDLLNMSMFMKGRETFSPIRNAIIVGYEMKQSAFGRWKYEEVATLDGKKVYHPYPFIKQI